MDIEKEKKIAEEKISDIIQEFSDKIYNEIVIPFCKKYKLSFRTGMGVYGFGKDKDWFLRPDMIKGNKNKQEFKIVCDILDEEIFKQSVFWYMEDYNYKK